MQISFNIDVSIVSIYLLPSPFGGASSESNEIVRIWTTICILIVNHPTAYGWFEKLSHLLVENVFGSPFN